MGESQTIRLLTADEEHELLAAAEGSETLLVEAALYSGVGLRRLETLRWNDLHLAKGKVRLTKAGHAPITPTFARALCELAPARGKASDAGTGDPGDGELGLRQIRKTIRRVAKRADVAVGERVLNATFAARWLRYGGPPGQHRLFGLPSPEPVAPGHDESRRGQSVEHWLDLARRAVTCLQSLDLRSQPAAVSAFAAGASALIDGWSDPRARQLLEQLREKRNPDGGFGLNMEYDAFQTGEVNPADTSYTVSMAGHVGRVLLDAARAGVVPTDEIERLVELMLDTPRCPGGPGTCFGYSMLQRDAATCVHNVNATAGWFLHAAQDLCPQRAELRRVVAEIAVREAATYEFETGSWRYMESTKRLNDFNHNAGSVEGTLRLVPAVGRHAAPLLMRRRDYETPVDPVGQIRLLPFLPSSMPHFAQEAERQVDRAQRDPMLLSQVAYWIARTARSELRRAG